MRDSSRGVYARLHHKKYIPIIALIFLCIAAAVLDVLTAAASPAYRLSTKEVMECLLHPFQAAPAVYVIVIKMRLPISIMALVIGFSLGTAGAVMQTILHNPLASPYTLKGEPKHGDVLVPPLKLCAWRCTFLTGEKSEDHYFFAEGLVSSAMAAWEPEYSIFFSGTVGCSTGKTASESNSCCCANFL